MRGSKAKRLRRIAESCNQQLDHTVYHSYHTPEIREVEQKQWDDTMKIVKFRTRGVPRRLLEDCTRWIYQRLKDSTVLCY